MVEYLLNVLSNAGPRFWNFSQRSCSTVKFQVCSPAPYVRSPSSLGRELLLLFTWWNLRCLGSPVLVSLNQILFAWDSKLLLLFLMEVQLFFVLVKSPEYEHVSSLYLTAGNLCFESMKVFFNTSRLPALSLWSGQGGWGKEDPPFPQ